MQPTDADPLLVRAAASGDSDAFGLLLERHYPALLRLCVQLVGELALAEDCAQDAAMVAWLRLGRLRAPEAFGAWLVGIGRHTCQHALRARNSTSTLDLASAGAVGDMREPELDVDVGQTLLQAIEDLPPGCRAAVRAFYLSGLDYREAAESLGIKLSALKVRLHGARQMLRHRFRLRDPASRERPFSPRTLAIHEAAHAVLYCRYGTDLERVSIAPRSAVWLGRGSDGVVSPGQLPLSLDLQVRMAGEVATRLAHCGVSGGDRNAAGAIALRETGGDQVEAALLLDHARRGARALLESSRIWHRVENVAAALLDVHTVDGDEVSRLCARVS